MGCCISSPSILRSNRTNSLHFQPSMANVITSTGQLRRYKVPVTVAQVLRDDDLSDSFFLCNSDSLFYEEYIKPMSMEEELQSGQIYFQLPSSRLRHQLTASDMAALAVKATIALQRIRSVRSDRRQNQKNRISPVAVVFEESEINSRTTTSSGNRSSSSSLPSRSLMKSGSVRRSQRFSSRRARITMAARSFRMSLSTIYEESILLL